MKRGKGEREREREREREKRERERCKLIDRRTDRQTNRQRYKIDSGFHETRVT